LDPYNWCWYVRFTFSNL